MTNEKTRNDIVSEARLQDVEDGIDIAVVERELQVMGDQLRTIRSHAEVGGQAVIDDLEERYNKLSREIAQFKLTNKYGDDGLSVKDIKRDAQETAERIGDFASEIFPDNDASHSDRSISKTIDEVGTRAEQAGHAVKLAGQDIGHGFAVAWRALKRDFANAYSRISDGGGNQDQSRNG